MKSNLLRIPRLVSSQFVLASDVVNRSELESALLLEVLHLLSLFVGAADMAGAVWVVLLDMA